MKVLPAASSSDPRFAVVPSLTGHYSEQINHYNLLATLEKMYGLSPVGNSSGAATISDIWS